MCPSLNEVLLVADHALDGSHTHELLLVGLELDMTSFQHEVNGCVDKLRYFPHHLRVSNLQSCWNLDLFEPAVAQHDGSFDPI